MNWSKVTVEKGWEGFPLPPLGQGASLLRCELRDPETGQCLGALGFWAYGPVCAYLLVEGLSVHISAELPRVAQRAVTGGESLLGLARAEVRRWRSSQENL